MRDDNLVQQKLCLAAYQIYYKSHRTSFAVVFKLIFFLMISYRTW